MLPIDALKMRNAAASLPPITMGNTGAINLAQSTSSNAQCGAAYQAAADGVLNYITITGQPGGSSAVNYRLCIYAATSQTVWNGALLGQTAVQNGLGVSEVKKVALTAPVNVTAGNWYAFTIQAEPPGFSTAESGSYGDRFFSDTYSDGAAATAGASAVNSGQGRLISASTN